MSDNIHPTAIVHPNANLASDVRIGAYAYIGAQVTLGAGTIIYHHATVDGNTTMGASNEVHPYAYVGGKTHDLKFQGGNPGLKIGDKNIFREYVTVHTATVDDTYTLLGSNNVLLAYSHVAHDCQIGNSLVMSAHAALGGHVVIEDFVNVGWGAGVHQFCRIGKHAMVGAASKLVQDLLPFMIADGNPAMVRTLNKVGMERNGFSHDDIELTRLVYRTFYRQGFNKRQACRHLKESPEGLYPIVKEIIAFAEASERGLA